MALAIPPMLGSSPFVDRSAARCDPFIRRQRRPFSIVRRRGTTVLWDGPNEDVSRDVEW